jgi:hypothetical protein
MGGPDKPGDDGREQRRSRQKAVVGHGAGMTDLVLNPAPTDDPLERVRLAELFGCFPQQRTFADAGSSDRVWS